MGHGHAYIRFNPDNRVFWTLHAGLPALDDVELDAAYRRAYRFLAERIKILVKDHKWKDIDFGNRQLLLFLTKEGYIKRFTLPHSFFPFLSVSQFSDWRAQFEGGVFEARKSSLTRNDFYIAGPSALSDIFYILQSVAPGMLIIGCQSGEDDMGDLECTRGLPPAKWAEEHAQMLTYIFGGSDQAYRHFLKTCRDEKAVSISWVPPTWSDDETSSECQSTGSTMVEEDYSDDNHLKRVGWSEIPAFDGRKCGSECGGCDRCQL